MLLLRSKSDSAAFNCALEEYLLTERSEKDVLLFYINRPSVVVGRNQSVEAEIDTRYCALHGIDVVRRLSGGGTVYHDRGNINYAFLSDKGSVPVLDRDFTAPIVEALASLGIAVNVGNRKELLAEGRKISGTASHVTRTRQLFHGTLLHRTDLGALALALRGDSATRGKAVASVPSPVVNLSTLTRTEETTEAFLGRMMAYFAGRYGVSPVIGLTTKEESRISEIMRDRYRP